MEAGRSGITENTPKRIMFGAGTIHKGLVYNVEDENWNFEETLVGATNGGSKFSITPEIHKIAMDGANVNVKGLTVKTGETAEMEINFGEFSTDLLRSAVLGTLYPSEDETLETIISKADIEEGDYWDNIAFVGRTVEGRNVIVIMENALCTSGFSSEGKNKAEGTTTIKFECHATLDGNHDKLPYKIYLPKE